MRWVINYGWSYLRGSTCKHLNKSSSDHVPVLLNWLGRLPIRGKKQFCYEEAWHMQEGCHEAVQDGMESGCGGFANVSGY